MEIKRVMPDKKLSLRDKAKKSVFSPNELFNYLKGEKGLTGAFLYHALISFVFLLLNAIVLFATGTTTISWAFALFGFAAALGFAALFIFLWVLMLAANFTAAAIGHVFAKLFGAKRGFAETYKAASYGFTPAALLGWLPIIGTVFIFQSLYYTVNGISILQSISRRRAFAAALIPIIIFFAMAAAFFYGMLMLIFDSALMPQAWLDKIMAFL